MFKNLHLFRIAALWSPDPAAAEQSLAACGFVPCGPTQPQSAGWVEPRGEAHGPMLEVVGGQWLMRLKIEQKAVPGALVRKRVEERSAEIEQSTGRRPGRKQKKALAEEIELELLPQAFPRQSLVWVWIDPKARLLAIDTGSAARAEDILTLMVKSLKDFAVTYIRTTTSPASTMAGFLMVDEQPAPFSVDRECELKSMDEMKSVVRYGRHPLDTDEVRAHIQGGKQPTRLALTWGGRVSFVLTDAMQLKRLEFLNVVFEGKADRSADEAFDADAAIATGELSRLIPDLLDAMGGEILE